MLTLEQRKRAATSVCLVRVESPMRDIDPAHQTRARVSVFFTQAGELVVGTKYRTYSKTSGHSVPTEGVEWSVMTQDELLALLLAEGIVEPLFEKLQAGKPDQIRGVLSKPMSEWSAEDRAQVHAYFKANRVE